ncbi:hypothetical protein M8J77_003674 [Diaphorina citri]|nr:hypothetical protein M8J77_003674 [Diaphorina citri]
MLCCKTKFDEKERKKEQKTGRGKLSTRNNILRKLVNQKWGAQPATLRTSALALCVSAAECAAPVWEASTHAKHVNVAINESARIISGCLRPTPISKLYPLIGIAPPDIRREVARDVERKKQIEDPRHSLHDHQPITRRLKSRKSFLARSCTSKNHQKELALLNGNRLFTNNLSHERNSPLVVTYPFLCGEPSSACESECPSVKPTWKNGVFYLLTRIICVNVAHFKILLIYLYVLCWRNPARS